MAEEQVGKRHHTSTVPAFACVISTNIPLAKLSHMAKPKINGAGNIWCPPWDSKGNKYLLNTNLNYHSNNHKLRNNYKLWSTMAEVWVCLARAFRIAGSHLGVKKMSLKTREEEVS